MSAENVVVPVDDPDRLLAGEHPYAPFAATKIQVYRYTSEANARAAASGTLVTTFTIVASTTAAADPNISGPFRYGYYDASQLSTSYYRYRFADTGLSNFSAYSEPWPAEPGAWALRDILFEVGDAMGGSVKKGVALSNSTANLIDCDDLFRSTKRDARLFEGWWALCSYDAAGTSAAPEGESAIIDSVDTSNGQATLDRSLTAAVTTGDVVLLFALLAPAEMIRVINRVREEMRFVVTVDIALSADEDRYPTPYGIWAESDILEGVGVIQYANSNRETEFEIDFRPRFDGFRGFIEISEFPTTTPLARFRVMRSYRDLEGELTTMASTTQAPIEWMRPAFALGIAQHLLKGDPNDADYQAWVAKYEVEARTASGRFAPDIVRRARAGDGRKVKPGPMEVW